VGPFALAVADGFSHGRGTLAVRMLGRTLQHEEGADWRGRVTSALALETPFVPGS
jgi:hypothetical protein